MCALASSAVGSTALLKRPPTSFSSASQEEPQKPSAELAGEAVDAADAERHRPVFRVDPADRLVAEVVALAVLRTVSAHSSASCLAPIRRILGRKN